MATLLVGYDLNKPGQRYERLYRRLKQLKPWWHYLDSTWLVRTSMTPKELRDDLRRFIDGDDELLVIDITGRVWAADGFDSYNWLHDNL